MQCEGGLLLLHHGARHRHVQRRLQGWALQKHALPREHGTNGIGVLAFGAHGNAQGVAAHIVHLGNHCWQAFCSFRWTQRNGILGMDPWDHCGTQTRGGLLLQDSSTPQERPFQKGGANFRKCGPQQSRPIRNCRQVVLPQWRPHS